MADPAPEPLTWYHATAIPAPQRPALEEEVEADVCVVGGGLCGVSAALQLAERGRSVVLLEAETVGFGASGRNGGQIVQGFSASMDVIAGQLGRDGAQALWDMSRGAIDTLEERVRRHKIDCDLRWGYLHAAVTDRQYRHLQAMAGQWAAYGHGGTTLLDERELDSVLNTDAYVGGLLDPESGQLHPLSYLRGLVGTAEFLGARIFEQSRATAIEPGDTVTVRTARGSVRAGTLVLAGNAYLGRLQPDLHRRLMPVASFIGVTEPIAPEVAGELFRRDVAVADGNMALDYYRMTADHRLLFGGGASYSARTPRNVETWIARRIEKVFPRLAGIRIEHAWGGLIGITLSRIPDIGRLADNVYYAQGFSGQGVALTGLAGEVIAEAIDGDDFRLQFFERVTHRPFPGGWLRTPLLMAVTGFAKLKDRLGV